ncbi:MAG TPA: toxin-antitoxin system YwqK family antitoxin [Elusimicrobiales bacterium]|nr:toxin-antitoxin system YwqK family antitoxin [Elusimicrobiales bacterium]
MKPAVFSFLLLLFPAAGSADTFLLKDGAKIEGEVTGEMDGTVLIKTKYGSLTINRADITEQQTPPVQLQVPAEAPQVPSAAAEAPAAPALPEAPQVSTPAAETPAAPPAQPEAPVQFTLATIVSGNGNRLLVYAENGVAIATETFDAAGARLSLEGVIKNGTYSEYYADGNLKTVKTLLGGKMSGSLKAYYPSGTLQVDAYYFDGAKEGDFKYFSEDGKISMEAAYKNDRLNGWKKEYDPEGALRNEAFYQDDKAVEPPKPAAGTDRPQEQESLVTAKVVKVARGEILTFTLNGKYIGKVRMDKEFNVTGQEGKINDGTVKIYTKDGKLQKELLFKDREVRILRLYEEGGPLKATYTYREGVASKFALK